MNTKRKKPILKGMMIVDGGAFHHLDHNQAVDLLLSAVKRDEDFGRVIDDVAIKMSIVKLNKLLKLRQVLPTKLRRRAEASSPGS